MSEWKMVPMVPTIEMLSAAFMDDASDGIDPESMEMNNLYVAMLEAAPTPPVPQPSNSDGAENAQTGWKLVPLTPTIDMQIAFAEAWYVKRRCIDDCEMEDCYAAMLEAAPQPSNELLENIDEVAESSNTFRNSRIVVDSAAPQSMTDDVSYEIVQDDMVVASASGPGAEREIMHYAAQYQQEGPLEIFKVVRTALLAAQEGE